MPCSFFKPYTNVLGVDTIMVARKLCVMLECSMGFPLHKNRMFATDHPEILLVALLVVATKLTFPFKGTSSPLELRFTPAFDWNKWSKVRNELSKHAAPEAKRPSFGKVTAENVASMNDDELSAYFAHVSSFIDRNSE